MSPKGFWVLGVYAMAQALSKALRAMPVQGIPAMMELLLEAGNAPVSLLLRDLVNLMSEETPGIQNFEAFHCALLHLLKAPGGKAEDLPFVVERLCFPLLTTATPFSAKASRFLAEAVAARSVWDYAVSSLVPACLCSISGQHEIGKTAFPLAVSCQVVADLITVAREAEASNFCSIMADTFWHPSLTLISQSLDDPTRSLAIQTLLSSLLTVFQEHPSCDFSELWLCCKSLFASGPSQRRDAYRVLSMLKPCLSTFELRAEPLFWEELRAGMINEDGLTRKRALHVLKFSLATSSEEEDHSTSASLRPNDGSILKKKRLTKREKWAEQEAKSLSSGLQHGLTREWKGFFLLYDILEGYGVHLVEAAWNDQIVVLMKAIKESDCSGYRFSSFDFHWMSILFERGLAHDNPHVKRLVMRSFLGLDWGNANLNAVVPRSFVLGSLQNALNDPVQHKDFGTNGIYSSETERHASLFFQAYTTSLDFRSRVHFIAEFSQAGIRQSLCRPGLVAFASCIEGAAFGGADNGKPVTDDGLLFEEVLDNLRMIVDSSRQQFNANYRGKVCSHVLRAIQILAGPSKLPFNKFSYFLGSFPPELINRGGALHGTLRSLFENGQECIVDGLRKSLSIFLKAPDKKYISDEDIDSWKDEADRWVRVFILVPHEERQIELLQLVEQYAMEIYHRVYMPPTVSEKVLLLLQCLLRKSSRSKDTETGLELYLTDFLRNFMGELRSHAEKCARGLLHYELSGPTEVPAAVLGKLGGASQRRLPSHAATAAIQGVLALQALSDCCSWLHANRQTCIDEPVGEFLCKVSVELSKPTQITEEIRGEFYLAALDGLAALCKTLPYIFSREMLLDANGSLQRHETIVDFLLKNILSSTTGITQDGKLARSRLAVLALHKWSCVDALLSIRNLKSGCSKPLSASTLLLVFRDYIDSLESAGEGYVLPLFKCLSSLMHWGVMQLQDSPIQVMWELVRSGWNCIVDCNKRRAAPIAAFLSAFLHPAVFCNMEMHSSNDQDGPLKWVLQQLIELGRRSPRTMRLTALHVTRLWLKFPETTVFYISELQLMSLYGSEVDEEVDGDLENLITLKDDADPELLEAFANTEMFTRVSVAVMMDKFAEVAERGLESERYKTAAANCGRCLLLQLLRAASKERDLAKELYSRKSIVHRRKTRVWQMLCILSRFLEESTLEEVLPLLEESLYKNNMPSVRQYMEIFAVQLYLRFPFLVKNRLVPFISDCNMKTQALSSYVAIAHNVVRHTSPKDAQQQIIEDVLPAILPHMTSHHHNLRTFCQVLIFELCRDIKMPEQIGSKCLMAIASYLGNNVDCTRLRQSVEEFLHALDPVAASKARGVFCERKSDLSKMPEDRPFECVPPAVLDQVAAFLNDAREDLRQSMASNSLVLRFGEQGGDPNDSTEAEGDYQRKINPYGDTVENDLPEIENEADLLFSTIERRGRELAKEMQGRQDLIVVASLIDRIPNLAGLARTCEVFKAAALTVGDAKILEDRQFKLISVTADQWVPILEVVEAGLEQFLKHRKGEGYTILGLEQTANSVSIDHYPFPKRAVLVLGREKEGIPVDIIHLLDACLEIPQLGMIRSLNVHVSGAIAIWEYTRQQLKGNKTCS